MWWGMLGLRHYLTHIEDSLIHQEGSSLYQEGIIHITHKVGTGRHITLKVISLIHPKNGKINMLMDTLQHITIIRHSDYVDIDEYQHNPNQPPVLREREGKRQWMKSPICPKPSRGKEKRRHRNKTRRWCRAFQRVQLKKTKKRSLNLGIFNLSKVNLTQMELLEPHILKPGSGTSYPDPGYVLLKYLLINSMFTLIHINII